MKRLITADPKNWKGKKNKKATTHFPIRRKGGLREFQGKSKRYFHLFSTNFICRIASTTPAVCLSRLLLLKGRMEVPIKEFNGGFLLESGWHALSR